jgi:hypothetical protein
MAGYAGAFIPAAKRPFNARSGGVFRAVFRRDAKVTRFLTGNLTEA